MKKVIFMAAAQAAMEKAKEELNILIEIYTSIPHLNQLTKFTSRSTGTEFKVNGNWDNNMIRISHWRESHCESNTSVGRKKNLKEQDSQSHSQESK